MLTPMPLAEQSFTIKSRTARRKTGRYFDQLLASQYLAREDIDRLQRRRAQRIAEFAAGNSRFYAAMFEKSGVRVDRLGERDEWQNIPVTTRAELKRDRDEVVSTEANKRTARSAQTGGSTGEPLRTMHDNRAPNLALAWRMYGWWGVQPWDNLARVGRWGFGTVDAIKNAISWWPSKQVYLDAQLFDENSMAAFYERLVNTGPALVEGYVGAMLEFANFLDAQHLTIPSIRAVATTAAPLTLNVRSRLETVYGVPIYDEYRGSEVNWIAGECQGHNGLHVFADARLVEVVDDNGRRLPNGQFGDIVVTDLTNRVFPIIRYKVGDRGVMFDHQCPCGVNLPMMGPPEGRTTDIVRLPSGRMINHGLMAMFAEHAEAVRIFQIHQTNDYAIHLRIVRGDIPNAERYIEEAVQQVRRRIEDEVPVSIEYVNAVPYTGGKTKFLISDIAR